MKKLSMLMAISIFFCCMLLPASASEVEFISPNAYENPLACPYCGALGYPTGKVNFSLSDDVTPQLFPIYQEYQCTADSSHLWYVYITDAVT